MYSEQPTSTSPTQVTIDVADLPILICYNKNFIQLFVQQIFIGYLSYARQCFCCDYEQITTKRMLYE